MRTNQIAAGLLAALASIVMAEAAGAADAYNGGQIARRWCVTCHVVAGDQQGTTGEAPPFASIAKRQGSMPGSSLCSCSTRIPRCRTCRSPASKPATSRLTSPAWGNKPVASAG